MRIPFVGGPYDGRELDLTDLTAHAHLLVERGDLGERAFALMPPPDDWEKRVRGEPAEAGPLTPYEREETDDGWRYRATAGEELVRANREARVKLTDRAKTALGQLSEQVRREVIDRVSTLHRNDPRLRGEFLPIPVFGEWPLYPLRVLHEWLAFARVLPDGQVELYDVMREETLQPYLTRFRAASPTR